MTRRVEADNVYTDRLVKLVPAEFVTAYVAISQSVQDELDLRQPVLLAVFILFVLVIPLYLQRVTEVTNRIQIAVTTASFVVWAYALGDAFQPGTLIHLNMYSSAVASVLLVVWTTVTPVFVKEPEPPQMRNV